MINVRLIRNDSGGLNVLVTDENGEVISEGSAGGIPDLERGDSLTLMLMDCTGTPAARRNVTASIGIDSAERLLERIALYGQAVSKSDDEEATRLYDGLVMELRP